VAEQLAASQEELGSMELVFHHSFPSFLLSILPPLSATFLIGVLFDLEDGPDMYLRNVGLSPNHTALQPQKTLHFTHPTNPE
jgi:hypothetical protein